MRKILIKNKNKILVGLLLFIFLMGCVTQAEVYDSYSKGGHPAGKSKLKKKHTKIGFTN